jgi:carbonic anhydrase
MSTQSSDRGAAGRGAGSIETALERNGAFAAAGGHEGAVVLPHLDLFVITCLDPRVDPAHVLGLELSDAIVVRNVGGRVTPEVINDVAFISQLAESLMPDGPLFDVAVIHHTQCGAGALADDTFRGHYAQRIGADELHRFLAACMTADRAQIEHMLRADPGLAQHAIMRHPDQLVRAAENENPDAVTVLIELGFDVNAMSRAAPLHEAAMRGNLELIELLLAHGADPDQRRPLLPRHTRRLGRAPPPTGGPATPRASRGLTAKGSPDRPLPAATRGAVEEAGPAVGPASSTTALRADGDPCDNMHA